MKTDAAKPARNFSETRCQHRSTTGRRCRSLRPTPGATLCERHRAMEEKQLSADLFASLIGHQTAGRDSLLSIGGVHDSLAELYILLARDRVSPRRAAVLAYVSSLLLRSLPDAAKVPAKSGRPKSPVRIILDMPHPAREDEFGDRPADDPYPDPNGTSPRDGAL